jgi:hypothetical protein
VLLSSPTTHLWREAVVLQPARRLGQHGLVALILVAHLLRELGLVVRAPSLLALPRRHVGQHLGQHGSLGARLGALLRQHSQLPLERVLGCVGGGEIGHQAVSVCMPTAVPRSSNGAPLAPPPQTHTPAAGWPCSPAPAAAPTRPARAAAWRPRAAGRRPPAPAAAGAPAPPRSGPPAGCRTGSAAPRGAPLLRCLVWCRGVRRMQRASVLLLLLLLCPPCQPHTTPTFTVVLPRDAANLCCCCPLRWRRLVLLVHCWASVAADGRRRGCTAVLVVVVVVLLLLGLANTHRVEPEERHGGHGGCGVVACVVEWRAEEEGGCQLAMHWLWSRRGGHNSCRAAAQMRCTSGRRRLRLAGCSPQQLAQFSQLIMQQGVRASHQHSTAPARSTPEIILIVAWRGVLHAASHAQLAPAALAHVAGRMTNHT